MGSEIIRELFFHCDEFFTLASFQKTVLDILQDFTKFFQADTPLIHKMIPEMKRLVRRLSALFVKPQYLDFIEDKTFSSSKLISLDDIFQGFSVAESVDQSVLHDLAVKVRKGLTDTAMYLMEKLPLSNKALRCFEALDPDKRRKTGSIKKLKQLKNYIQCRPLNESAAIQEITEFCSDNELPKSRYTDNTPVPLDEWWHSIGNMKNADSSRRYEYLHSLVKAVITCFHGPKVEGSFSLMNMTSTEFRPRLSVESMSVSLIAQYRRKVFGDCVSQFGSSNPRYDPIPSGLAHNMRKAWKVRKENQVSKRLLKKASERLSEAGLKERREREERKKLMDERRKILRSLVCKRKAITNENLIHDLPPIPKIAEENQEIEGQIIESDESDDRDTLALPPPPKKTKQVDIRAMFFRK